LPPRGRTGERQAESTRRRVGADSHRGRNRVGMTQGRCLLCKTTFSKATMAKHLRVCRETHAPTASLTRLRDRHVSIFHILAEGRYAPEYWILFDVPAVATLANVDSSLRKTWLECCGHLSAFTIQQGEYLSDLDDDYDDEDAQDMKVPIGVLLEQGTKFHHLYDFGTATELTLKVVSRREASVRNRRIRLLARNEPPRIPCEVCGDVAVWVCPQCLNGTVGWVCNKCAEQHECGKEMLLPVVNSPRLGCAATRGKLNLHSTTKSVVEFVLALGAGNRLRR